MAKVAKKLLVKNPPAGFRVSRRISVIGFFQALSRLSCGDGYSSFSQKWNVNPRLVYDINKPEMNGTRRLGRGTSKYRLTSTKSIAAISLVFVCLLVYYAIQRNRFGLIGETHRRPCLPIMSGI